MKSVQIRARNNSVLGHFSPSEIFSFTGTERLMYHNNNFDSVPPEKKRFIQVSREIQSCCSEEKQTFFSAVIHVKVIALSFFDCPLSIYLLNCINFKY